VTEATRVQDNVGFLLLQSNIEKESTRQHGSSTGLCKSDHQLTPAWGTPHPQFFTYQSLAFM